MKTAKEVFEEMAVGLQTASRWIDIIEKAQKEAWNEAIEAAAENAKTKNTQVMINANSTNAYTVGGIEVDKQSILKLVR